MTAEKNALSMFTIDCQRKANDNAGIVARDRNCTITHLIKTACFDDEEIVRAYRKTTQRT